MHDNWIIAMALAISGSGMAGLMFALIFIELPESGILEAQATADGAPVRLRGEAVSVRQRGDITTISLSQPQVLEVVVFANISVNSVHPNDCIVVQGKRSSYDGKAQITATRVSKC